MHLFPRSIKCMGSPSVIRLFWLLYRLHQWIKIEIVHVNTKFHELIKRNEFYSNVHIFFIRRTSFVSQILYTMVLVQGFKDKKIIFDKYLSVYIYVYTRSESAKCVVYILIASLKKKKTREMKQLQ